MGKKLFLSLIFVSLSHLLSWSVVYHDQTEKVTNFDYSSYTVTYTDINGLSHTVPLTDEAVTPEHMMALLRKVYTDPTIPGIRYAYDYDGTQYRKIDYNKYGHLGDGNGNWLGAPGEVYPNPYEDGMTLLLVQVREDWRVSYHDRISNMREYFERAYTSIRLIPDFTRLNNEQNPGYLFSLDVAANRFFFISKGKPRSTYTKPLFRLYEQISPVNPHAGDAATVTFIDDVRAGNPYYCYHDCTNVTSMTGGHWFTISNAGENYGLDNLSIFIPDRRFEYELTNSSDNYINSSYFNEYGNSQNPGEEDWTVMPRVLLYRVNLSGSVRPEGDDYFTIHLDWSSSFANMDVPEHFYVYQVDEAGNRVLLTTIENQPTTSLTHEYLVERQVESQVFHYIVTGAPINYDNDGNVITDSIGNPLVTIHADSKVCTLVVPGRDPYFTGALEYRSRYDVDNEVNRYKNKIEIGPSTEDDYLAIKNDDKAFDLYRVSNGGDSVIIANIIFSYDSGEEMYRYSVSYMSETQDLTLLYDDEAPLLSGEFSAYADAHVSIIDRFTASTAQNSHTNGYTYVLMQSGEPHSNDCRVPVHKTTNSLSGVSFTSDEVYSDTCHTLNGVPTTAVTFDAMNNPLAHIERYDVYKKEAGKNWTKSGKAENTGNSGNYCVIGVGSGGYINDVQSWTQVGVGGGKLTLYDRTTGEGETTFVPVVASQYVDGENTYGCEFSRISYPYVDVIVCDVMKTLPFYRQSVGAMRMGYTAGLRMIPTLTDSIDNVYYYRVWRVMDASSTDLAPETLLNNLSEDVASVYGMSYHEIQTYYPGDGTVAIFDLFEDRPLEAGMPKKVTYIIRMYSTPLEEGRRGGDKDYFISEKVVTVVYDESVFTSVADVSEASVVNVCYYSLDGIRSRCPFDGACIEVKTLSDGRTVARKIVR